ncbi:NAD(P)-dependent oxidoreductase [Phycicoccus endophyticus]|uniref:NAD(P)-dependent oxidoreductase n=1 Tax=Phycicoccus endophyticus TaxID=1690220 RepID=A0A7G9QZC5_9MICO|nr:NAD(P)-dependent oxidoreductase [Phycicoccus endophyticus]NHI19055.1 NAD(P)-dependent oxidoreductase [Phycicoccus endophyticus]QNN48700.1 NAD(P)-dependent oxidoreductase [Phycicoccus endophyticus]GGL32511.1 NAD-dependent L-serine dehydrogenase [Phycicoccus endophyticus]
MSTTVGFVGVGHMGSRMIRCLAAAGFDVVAYDRSAEALASLPVTALESPEQVAATGVDVVLLSLPDSRAVEDVVRGPQGLAGGLAEGAVVVDLTTSAPETTVALHEHLGRQGVRFLDAGVSGGAAAAAKGTLTLMVGAAADDEVLTRLAPVFDAIARAVFPLGRPGAGHAAKILNNFLNAVNLSASAEVFVAAARSGLDLHVFLEAVNASSGANWATLNRFPALLTGDYLEGGLSSALMMKDLLLYAEHVGRVGVPSLHLSGPVAAFGTALQTGRADQISNRVVDALGDLADGVRLSQATSEESTR